VTRLQVIGSSAPPKRPALLHSSRLHVSAGPWSEDHDRSDSPSDGSRINASLVNNGIQWKVPHCWHNRRAQGGNYSQTADPRSCGCGRPRASRSSDVQVEEDLRREELRVLCGGGANGLIMSPLRPMIGFCDSRSTTMVQYASGALRLSSTGRLPRRSRTDPAWGAAFSRRSPTP
jgi:hypothetical protein